MQLQSLKILINDTHEYLVEDSEWSVPKQSNHLANLQVKIKELEYKYLLKEYSDLVKYLKDAEQGFIDEHDDSMLKYWQRDIRRIERAINGVERFVKDNFEVGVWHNFGIEVPEED